ncbi:MAG: hypothetical protein V1898_03915 [Patescibacteria group bacterium]
MTQHDKLPKPSKPVDPRDPSVDAGETNARIEARRKIDNSMKVLREFLFKSYQSPQEQYREISNNRAHFDTLFKNSEHLRGADISGLQAIEQQFCILLLGNDDFLYDPDMRVIAQKLVRLNNDVEQRIFPDRYTSLEAAEAMEKSQHAIQPTDNSMIMGLQRLTYLRMATDPKTVHGQMQKALKDKPASIRRDPQVSTGDFEDSPGLRDESATIRHYAEGVVPTYSDQAEPASTQPAVVRIERQSPEQLHARILEGLTGMKRDLEFIKQAIDNGATNLLGFKSNEQYKDLVTLFDNSEFQPIDYERELLDLQTQFDGLQAQHPEIMATAIRINFEFDLLSKWLESTRSTVTPINRGLKFKQTAYHDAVQSQSTSIGFWARVKKTLGI